MNTQSPQISGPIPIVFVLKGDSWYLPYVLNQALSVNNNAHVTLLSDTKANGNINGLDLIPMAGSKMKCNTRLRVYQEIIDPLIRI